MAILTVIGTRGDSVTTKYFMQMEILNREAPRKTLITVVQSQLLFQSLWNDWRLWTKEGEKAECFFLAFAMHHKTIHLRNFTIFGNDFIKNGVKSIFGRPFEPHDDSYNSCLKWMGVNFRLIYIYLLYVSSFKTNGIRRIHNWCLLTAILLNL